MWPHSSRTRPWANSLIGNDSEILARWCLDGLPNGPTIPWQGLWRVGSLYCVQRVLSCRDRRHLRRKGNIGDWRQELQDSYNRKMLPPSGFAGLVPPSHFQARPLPTLPRMAPTWASDVPLVQSPASQDVLERRLDAQRSTVTTWGQDFCGDGQGLGRRGRSLELGFSSALSQQAELISRQLQELRRLEEEVRSLRETSLQQKMRLETQAVELDALAVAEKAGQAEAEGLRTALAGAEMVRKNLEEAKHKELEEIQSLHQEQLSSLTQAHQKALDSLASKAEGLEKSLNSLETKRAGEAKQLAMAQKEADMLRNQLSKTQEELEAQVTLVESLRKYVGEQVLPEFPSQEWELERKELLDTLKHLKEDRADLQATVELLQVRVQSLTHMLALQEEELTRKIQPLDPLEPEFPKKCRSLLRNWREKVFALMVQLKAQDLQHRDSTSQLRIQVAELQEQVTSQSQEQAILQRALQDKTAQVEVERMSTKSLQMELDQAQEARRRQEQQIASAEEQLKFVVGAMNSTQAKLQSTMTRMDQAVARIPSLSNRLSYAVRKVHTIKGLMARKVALAQLRVESSPPSEAAPPLDTDLSVELEQLREERNRLDAELQLSAHLIQQEVGRAREQGEVERRRLIEVAQQLEQELQRAQESLASVGQQLEAARRGQQESTEEAASLRQELTQQQEIYGQALQEKVAEVETRLREQLSDTKRRLNEARREQAKAVVSLRQIQHKATQEKERNQELRRLQDEARKEEGQRLTRRVQELERDKNLMLQQRLLAVLPSGVNKKCSPRSVESSSSESPAAASCKESVKGSLTVLLDNLQGLSEAISRDEDICVEDNQNTKKTKNPPSDPLLS
ncbi:coiled-coil alpha-helical rod protein 1 isoform X2 [Mus musculus]|uniref:coiled-coil alpha-helical rod protein 1 isoform X2 n=1 Tax=Mus musculus TaxID=10090 RepID=UPI0005ABA535|nr:coiled-coil alpha-helical rod protein 1 isoform X2 [Mus musculus]|eukprot:XP_011244748.1 PREDICTED: coiled-coil alpha-helical rod protein 1 isoform X2 [Mus musculus]